MKKKILTGVGALFVLIVGFGVFGSNGYIDLVKEGVPNGCEYNIGEMVDEGFNDNDWEVKKIGDNRVVVNVTGEVDFRDKTQDAFMQFEVDGDEFWLQSLELNGQPQSQMMIRSFSNHLCDAAGR